MFKKLFILEVWLVEITTVWQI